MKEYKVEWRPAKCGEKWYSCGIIYPSEKEAASAAAGMRSDRRREFRVVSRDVTEWEAL